MAFSLFGAGGLAPTVAQADDDAPQGRIIGGTLVPQSDVSATGRWSAVVAVFATDDAGTRLCTGTLIAPNWVATAAHCLAQSANATQAISPESVFVAPGITNITNAGDTLVPAVSTHVHPGFSWTNASWDVSLIELASTVPATPFALPDPLRASTYAPGTTENIAGFGRSQSTNSASSGTLRTGRLEQVNAAACASYNPGSGAYADCYSPGATRQSTCFGDSGGPLVRYDTTQGGSPVLWGITSTGPDPCDAATGGAFAPAFETRVTSVEDWLSATMSGSTYVPTQGATARISANSSPAAVTSLPAGTVTKTRAPAGGTGIGIFQAKVGRKPTATRTGRLALASSFVGATGTGDISIERCKKGKCKSLVTTGVNFTASSQVVHAAVSIPRCAKGTTMNVRLSVRDDQGDLRDSAVERIARCR